MAQKYYAIKKGMNPATGEAVSNVVVTTWPQCQNYIKGVKGAVYKSFLTIDEAEAYLSENNNFKKGVDEYPADIPHIYVDGSYNISSGDYGYGIVVVHNGIVEHAAYGNGHEEEDNQRQVNGELHGAVEGIRYSIQKGYRKIVLFYDYAGVCQHATGGWSRNTSLSKWYYEEVEKLRRGHDIEIIFVKIDSHTGDLFNDAADELAKVGAGVEYVSAVDKALKTDRITVADENVKMVMDMIIKKNFKSISIAGNETAESTAAAEILSKEAVLKEKQDDEEDIEAIIAMLMDCDDKALDKKLKSLKTKTKSTVIKHLIKKIKNNL